jgi:hypothetical protein
VAVQRIACFCFAAAAGPRSQAGWPLRRAGRDRPPSLPARAPIIRPFWEDEPDAAAGVGLIAGVARDQVDVKVHDGLAGNEDSPGCAVHAPEDGSGQLAERSGASCWRWPLSWNGGVCASRSAGCGMPIRRGLRKIWTGSVSISGPEGTVQKQPVQVSPALPPHPQPLSPLGRGAEKPMFHLFLNRH